MVLPHIPEAPLSRADVKHVKRIADHFTPNAGLFVVDVKPEIARATELREAVGIQNKEERIELIRTFKKFFLDLAELKNAKNEAREYHNQIFSDLYHEPFPEYCKLSAASLQPKPNKREEKMEAKNQVKQDKQDRRNDKRNNFKQPVTQNFYKQKEAPSGDFA